MQVVILAAGRGTRLGRSLPKPLTPLVDGRSILRQQIDNVHWAFGDDADIMVVVGHQARAVMSHVEDDAAFLLNERYAETNTAKSLLLALDAVDEGHVVWMNGDVVFHPAILVRLAKRWYSGLATDRSAVGEEEIKYSLDCRGRIRLLSKEVDVPCGEAVGVNMVTAEDRPALVRHLAACSDGDYFEKGIETGIAAGDFEFRPVDVTDLFAVEVDFEADIGFANEALAIYAGRLARRSPRGSADPDRPPTAATWTGPQDS